MNRKDAIIKATNVTKKKMVRRLNVLTKSTFADQVATIILLGGQVRNLNTESILCMVSEVFLADASIALSIFFRSIPSQFQTLLASCLGQHWPQFDQFGQIAQNVTTGVTTVRNTMRFPWCFRTVFVPLQGYWS